ncbi:Uncharacterised protein [Serratia fonticola]|uniref:Uncharacterized protein n=1 Tax=Serratia fonticola TaxID=47917 RepID=A0A4U9W3G2_SERFO|nr:Uncharacterised protein [Serratia fonticola]
MSKGMDSKKNAKKKAVENPSREKSGETFQKRTGVCIW